MPAYAKLCSHFLLTDLFFQGGLAQILLFFDSHGGRSNNSFSGILQLIAAYGNYLYLFKQNL